MHPAHAKRLPSPNPSAKIRLYPEHFDEFFKRKLVESLLDPYTLCFSNIVPRTP